ncbi:MAG: hypothetical protein Q8R02_14820 [Hyphomonadaceae bacterium]|nr:hypothetical protein [Hyphomonadaceae bacterium]
MSTHVEELIANPHRHFDHPTEVLDEPGLSVDEKRRILESWKQDAQRLAESTAENMSGGEETDLRDVSKVLLQLKEMEKTPAAATQPARQNTSGLGAGLFFGALIGAGAGLVIAAVTGPSIAVVAEAALVGLIIGGVAISIRNAVRA